MHNKKVKIVTFSFYRDSLNYRLEKLLIAYQSRNDIKFFNYILGIKSNVILSPVINMQEMKVVRLGLIWRIVFRVFDDFGLIDILPHFLFNLKRHVLIYLTLIKILSDRNLKKSIFLFVTPPHELFILIIMLRRLGYKNKFIIDLQDMWSFDEYYSRNKSKKDKMRQIEDVIYRYVDKIIVTNEKAKEHLINVSKVSTEKLCVMEHPYDITEYIEKDIKIKPKNEFRGLKFGFFGTLFKEPKVPGPKLLSAFEYLILNFDESAELHVIGRQDSKLTENYNSFLNKNIILHGHKSISEALDILNECDFLLVILGEVPNCKIIMHSKLPHYLRLRKPILAFGPSGSYLEMFIEITESGLFFNRKDWGTAFVDLYSNIFGNKLNSLKYQSTKFSLDTYRKHWDYLIMSLQPSEKY